LPIAPNDANIMDSRGFAYSIDLAKARIHVNRAKNGEPSTHPLSGVELRALLNRNPTATSV